MRNKTFHSIELFMSCILAFFLSSCGPALTPFVLEYPTQTYVTPFSMEAAPGEAAPTVPVSAVWGNYNDPELGLQVQYPPDWTAVKQVDTLGVGLYPPGSSPDLATANIMLSFLNEAYTEGNPLYDAGSTVSPINIAGIEGQQYQDTEFTIPTQSFYIELPYHDGTLLIDATQGPVVDLTPQLFEILKTLTLSSPGNPLPIVPTLGITSTMVLPIPTSNPVIINPTPSSGQVIISADPVSGKSPLTVSFSAGFQLPDGENVCSKGGSCTFFWDVNGKASRSMSYTFRKPGSYFVSVSVCYSGTCRIATQGIVVTR